MTMSVVPASTAWPQRSVPLMRSRDLRSVSRDGDLNDRLRALRAAETEASQVLNRASSGPRSCGSPVMFHAENPPWGRRISLQS
jgi:hypothetical protein